VFQEYAVDFDKSIETIIQFVFRYIEGDYDIESILEQVNNQQILIKYE
jgi:hypothetical protein